MPIFQFTAWPLRTLRAWVALLACLAAALAQAQQGLSQAGAAATPFRIAGFELTGDIPLAQEETTRLLAPFLGPKATLSTLQQASAALEAALKTQGYTLHRVSLPAQELGGRVKLVVVKFVIGKVSVEGHAKFSDAQVRASLPELQEGATPNFRVMAVQTALANENPARQVQVVIKESAEPDKIDARVLVQEGPLWNAALSLANTGSDATGNDRLSLVLGHSNVFGLDHQVAGAYTSSVERSDQVQQVGLNYRIPLYRQGAMLGMSYTESSVVGHFGSFNSTGSGTTLGLNYSLYRPPQGGSRSYWTGSLDDKVFHAAKINGAVVAGLSDRGSRPLTLGYTRRVESDARNWSYSAELAFNLAGSSGNNLAAYQSEDQRIRTVNWSVLHLGLDYLAPLPGGWLWRAKGQAQYSGDALIVGEQFGLGGAASVRGTGERVLAGDSGVLASLELSGPELLPGLRLMGFVDGGWLGNNHAAASSAGKLANDQLSSAGLGLQLHSRHATLLAQWGHVVGGASQPVGGNPALPKAGDEKLHLSLSARF
jgi:hemolysin activation/secretion protein